MDKPAILRRALACLIVAATLFCLISLLTYDTADVPSRSQPPADPVNNRGGVAGAYLAFELIDWLGLASYLLVALGAAWGMVFLIRKNVTDLWLKLIGAMLLLNAASAALGMIPRGPAWGWGGKLGRFYNDKLAGFCGTPGAVLIICLAAVFGLIFLGLDHYVVMAAAAIWRKTRAAAAKRRDRRASKKIEHAITVVEKTIEEPAVSIGKATRKRGTETPEKQPAEAAAAADGEPGGQGESRTRIEQRLTNSIKKATQPPKTPAKLLDSRDARGGYQFPPLDILDDPEYHDASDTQTNIEDIIAILETTLADFNIGAKVVDIDRGPVVTRYELDLAPGIKVTRITSLADDIAMAVKASSVRIVAPIPGKSTVGVEIPNKIRQLVRLKELIASKEYKKARYVIPVMLGKDTSGKPIMTDLTRMPHLLIAGATGAGKSVCINSILMSILMTKRPDDLQLILIDPKMVELSIYEGVPHLLCPVVTDMKRAPWILEWATKQMDERYDFLNAVGVRQITQYNALGEEEIAKRLRPDADADRIPNHLPYIVIVIDELADLMMSSAKEVESSITRLAQKSRAVGIHILVATQRPSVDVITGLIKANMPTRISFQVTSKTDSRTILDRNGAEALLGMGDQLFLPPGTSDLLRLQGTFVSDQEIRRIVTFVKQSAGSGQYKLDLDNWGVKTDDNEGPDDELYEQAIRVVLENQRGSVSLLQRKLEIGYTRASRLVDYMAKDGFVGSYKGSKAREVLMTLEEWEGQVRPQGYGQASLPDHTE